MGHGITTSQNETTVSTPNTAASGIVFAIGTAPVHRVGGTANQIIIASTYAEAATQLGYSDDWTSYTLCEVMYSHFKLFGMGPVVFANVLDPTEHKEDVAAADMSVTDKQVKLTGDAIDSSVVVKIAEATAVKGTDYDTFYDTFYDGEHLVIELIDSEATTINVEYSKVKPSMVTKTQIIGGVDSETQKATGIELIEQAFAMFTKVPDIIIAPGFSHESEVAAVMAAKADKINGLFGAKALIDSDTSASTDYAKAITEKSTKSITDKRQMFLWPMGKLGDKKFHLSTQLAGRMALTDSNNDGCPSNSPSNKKLQVDSLCLADGTDVALSHTQANMLNDAGILTAINFTSGFVAWGNITACYPANTDVKDYFISVSRMFDWVANSIILTYWNKLDTNITKRFVESIVDSINIWLNGLTSEGKLLGGSVEFRSEDNSTVDLMAGKIKFIVKLTPPSPAQEMEFALEYDVDALTSALTI